MVIVVMVVGYLERARKWKRGTGVLRRVQSAGKLFGWTRREPGTNTNFFPFQPAKDEIGNRPSNTPLSRRIFS